MGLNVSLTPHLEDFVRQKVAEGRYNNASEVVREALRLLERENQIQEAKLDALRRDIQQGLDSPVEPFDLKALRQEALNRHTSR